MMVGVPHRFTVVATWSDSSTSAPPHMRWRVGASGDGDIDSAGVLIARRPGTIVVVVTAGGWRTTSRRMVAIASTTRLVAAEDWTNGPRRDALIAGVAQKLHTCDGSADCPECQRG